MSKTKLVDYRLISDDDVILTLSHTEGFIFRKTKEFKVRGNPHHDEWYHYPSGESVDWFLENRIYTLLELHHKELAAIENEKERLERVKKWEERDADV